MNFSHLAKKNFMKYDDLFYLNTNVLKNKLCIKEKDILDEKDYLISSKETISILKSDVLKFDVETYLNINKTLFSKLYNWAGNIRKFDIYKGESVLDNRSVRYCPVIYIENNLEDCFSKINDLLSAKVTDKEKLIKFTDIFSYLRQIHPFYEGNTRTTTVFMILLAKRINLNIDFGYLFRDPKHFRDLLVLSTLGIEDTENTELYREIKKGYKRASKEVIEK